MKRFAIALAMAACGTVVAQETRPVKIQIRHADPWAVKAMLEGVSILSPEISTVLLLTGQQGAAGQATGNPWFPQGTLMVNPADNTLWFVPRRANQG